MRQRIKDIRQLSVDRCRLLLTQIDLELMEPEPDLVRINQLSDKITDILADEINKG